MRRQALNNSLVQQPSVYEPEYLRKQTHWLRNDLDPRIAQDGPDVLHSDEVLKVDEFFRRLLTSHLVVDDLRFSRIHLAVDEITGRGTRWPRRLIERCEALKEAWETSYGPLKQIGILLYEPGGHLHGICQAEDVNKDKLFMKWLKAPGVPFSPLRAKKVGDLGFTAGDWWINPLFALHAGIIDSSDPKGGIVSDAKGAYAVVMAERDEVAGSTPEQFIYRARVDDTGRYRLTSGTPESRHPVRILRSHSLRSLYTPKAGLRYDGLHKVTGWTVKPDPNSRHLTYEITFSRLANEPDMAEVLRRPFAEEVEDYREYKRIREMNRHRQGESKPSTAVTGNSDGAFDDEEDQDSCYRSTGGNAVPEIFLTPASSTSAAHLQLGIDRHDSGMPSGQ